MPARLAIIAAVTHLAVLLFLWVQPARAQWAVNGIRICAPIWSSNASGVVSDAAGGIIVAWSEFRAGTDQIYLQRVSSTGTALWAAGGIQIGAAYALVVAADGSGGAIVVWGAVANLYAQRVDGSGNALWAAGGALLLSPGSGTSPTAIMEDGSGGVIFVWYAPAPADAWYVQRLDSSGALLWAGNGVQVPRGPSRLISDGSGGAIVAWLDSKQVRLQRISSDGTTLWGSSGVLASRPPYRTYEVALTSDGGGGAIVAWTDSALAVYAQRVSASGALAWPVSACLRSESYYASESSVRIVADDSHGAIVTWAQRRIVGAAWSYDICAQRVDASGTPLWTPNGVPVCVATDQRDSPIAVADGAGGAVIVWRDNRRGSTRQDPYTYAWDVYAQRLDPAGQSRWADNGLPLSIGSTAEWDDSGQTPTGLVSDGLGGAIALWDDFRFSGARSIYAQNVPAAGSAPYIEEVEPRLTSVRDVPWDQGGKVFITWLRSAYDIPGLRLITGYVVWRRVPPPVTEASPRPAISGKASREAPIRVSRISRPDGGMDVTYWEQMATLRAEQLPGYGFTAPTTQDSMAGSNPYTAFFVTAITSDPFTFYESAPDSGYSVDNLSPPSPTPFTAAYTPTSTTFHWGRNPAADFREFQLHRGTTMDFVPGPANLVIATQDTGYVDAAGGGYFYKLAAVDIHGNQSLFALVSPTGPVATLASLTSIDAWPDRIRLTWYAAGNPGVPATVYRRSADADWAALGHITADGAGYLRYEDTAVQVGMRYGYRLGIMDGGTEVFVGEAWAAAEQLVFALQGARPNPAAASNLRVHFTLPTTEPAKLELVDIAGRRVAWRDVGSLGPGPHVINFSESGRIPPGIYLVRLTQGENTRVVRVTVLN